MAVASAVADTTGTTTGIGLRGTEAPATRPATARVTPDARSPLGSMLCPTWTIAADTLLCAVGWASRVGQHGNVLHARGDDLHDRQHVQHQQVQHDQHQRPGRQHGDGLHWQVDDRRQGDDQGDGSDGRQDVGRSNDERVSGPRPVQRFRPSPPALSAMRGSVYSARSYTDFGVFTMGNLRARPDDGFRLADTLPTVAGMPRKALPPGRKLVL